MGVDVVMGAARRMGSATRMAVMDGVGGALMLMLVAPVIIEESLLGCFSVLQG